MHKRISVFVDGENFRQTLCDLFPIIKSQDWYLPRTKWGNFFDYVTEHSVKELGSSSFSYEIMRCYWYVVGEFEHTNYFETQEFKALPLNNRLDYFIKNAKSVVGDQSALASEKSRHQCVDRCAKHLASQLKILKQRESRWKSIQEAIQKETNKVEFRKFGHIFVHLDGLKFQTEKGTDVKLAMDMHLLKDTYDIAVLVSGDADYIPAVEALKVAGKHVVNVDFLNTSGELLPGGARKLKMHSDATLSIPYANMQQLMGITPVAKKVVTPVAASGGDTTT